MNEHTGTFHPRNPEHEPPMSKQPRCSTCGRGASHTVGITRPVTVCFNGHKSMRGGPAF